jgi:YspA, cpYpsA-related SLOG family
MTCALVCGGRRYDDRTALFAALDGLHSKLTLTRIIHGGARGADTLAAEWAAARGVAAQAFPAHWERHGTRAGAHRNQQMLDEGRPDVVVAFPGTSGTFDMCRRAEATGVRLIRAP